MKKFFSVVAFALLATFGAVGVASADPVGDLIPACTISIYTPYQVPVVAYCEEYKAPTGQVLVPETYIAHP